MTLSPLLTVTASLALVAAHAAQDPATTNLDAPAPSLTLEQHLKAATPPVFREGHTLLPLSRWGWSMPFEVRVELTEKWGYALEFGGYVTDATVDEVERHPTNANARIVALAASDPQRYPLAVLTHRPLGAPSALPADLRDAYYLKGTNGLPVSESTNGTPSWRAVSPLAPDAIFEWAAQGTVAPLLRLSRKAPLAIILNGGEYGLPQTGHGKRFWEKDAAVMAAKGDRTWLAFVSEQKARQEGIIADAVREAFPTRRLYLWYHFGGIPSWDFDRYSFDTQLLRVSDYPDQSLYYLHFNAGWTGDRDLLSNFTYSLAQAIPLGHPLSYNWVCGGWKKDAISAPDRYMGFLKCLYACGQIGAVAGYFSLPEGLDGKPVAGDAPPPHLQQTMALGHVQALFSHVEEFVRQGDLLPGPLTHARNATLPAYDFLPPTNAVRVFVRKQRDRDAWLIAAWAAGGNAREAEIDVPGGLGAVTVLARPAGSVYLATAETPIPHEPPVVTLDLLDEDPMDPTARWRTAP